MLVRHEGFCIFVAAAVHMLLYLITGVVWPELDGNEVETEVGHATHCEGE